jgi:hypothetical protein
MFEVQRSNFSNSVEGSEDDIEGGSIIHSLIT